jgi:HAMP domain-containing protein
MRSFWNIRTIALVGGGLLVLVPAIIAGVLYSRALQERAQVVVAESLRWRGQLAAQTLARRLFGLWRDIDGMSRVVRLDELKLFRSHLAFLNQMDPRYTWVGIADTYGQVLAATGGMIEGTSVADQPWFRRGLEGPTAVDVHTDLLARLLPPIGNGPLRFIDLAAPVRDRNQVIGVLGSHINWTWVQDQLSSLAIPEADILLISRDRRVLYGPPDLLSKQLTLGAAISASNAAASTRLERWPDGKDYLTVVLPAVTQRGMPTFGWSMIVRQNVDTAFHDLRMATRAMWFILAGTALSVLVLLNMAARWLATPIQRTLRFAEGMAAGDTDQVPREETRYEEATRLGAALVRIQSRLRKPPEKGTPPEA